MQNIREYRSMISTKNSIEDYNSVDTILEMKLRLEYRRKALGKVPLDYKDFEQIFSEMATKYLQERGKEQSDRPYERETSKRTDFNFSSLWEEMAKQDINDEHEGSIAHYVPGLDNKINDYIFQTPIDIDALQYAEDQLGKEYAEGLEDGKSELARQFAVLQVQGSKGSFVQLQAEK